MLEMLLKVGSTQVVLWHNHRLFFGIIDVPYRWRAYAVRGHVSMRLPEGWGKCRDTFSQYQSGDDRLVGSHDSDT